MESEELLTVIMSGDLDRVRQMLTDGADVNPEEDDYDPEFPLNAAVDTGNQEMVKLLLEFGADVNRAPGLWPSPLVQACERGDIELVRVLLEHGAEVNLVDRSIEETALKAASRHGHIDLVRVLLQKGAEVNQVTDAEGISAYFEEHTALMAAFCNDHIDIARVLLEHGAKVNIPNPSDKSTALMVAAARGNLELVNLLIDRGANLEQVNKDGWTSLMRASHEGETEAASVLIDRGADINIGSQVTALMLACANGHEETVRMLINKGADINFVSDKYGSALKVALNHGYGTIAVLLLENGATPRLKGFANMTGFAARRLTPPDKLEVHRPWDEPNELMWASHWGLGDVVSLLLKRGARAELWDASGRTALMIAAGEGHVEVIQTLLENASNVNAQDADGLTALMWASCWGRQEAVLTLLELGASPQIKDRGGNAALDWANKGGHRSVSLILSEALSQESYYEAPDFELQVRQAYPFPLAYPYRLIDNHVEPYECYVQMLRVGENIMAFLGSVALALAKASNLTPPESLNMNPWQGGISPGSWLDLFRHALDKIDRESEDPLGKTLSRLWWKGKKRKESDFSKELRRVASVKNDFKHDRGPMQGKIRRACEDLRETLVACMKQLAFFVDHPIRLIESMDFDQRNSWMIFKCCRFAGDHPVHLREEINHHEPLPVKSLHMQISDQIWIPLFPFISVQNCAECSYQETYFIDRWNGKGKPCHLKSFERGHTYESDDVGEALQKWIQED